MSVACLICGKLFSCQSSANRHRKESHNLNSSIVEYEKSHGDFKCFEENCNVSFNCCESLRSHLKMKHTIDGEEFDVIVIDFESISEFDAWLLREEKENLIQYTKKTGVKRSKKDLTETTYFYCARSGFQPVPTTNSKRFPRSQGSRKIGTCCTSQVILKHNTVSNKCQVKYYKSHYGHKNEVQHLRMHESDKKIVASKLMLGVPSPRILNSIREAIDSKISRTALMTREDINNIKIAYNININDGYRHYDDATSVDIWVHQCSEAENNPVILYTKQGGISHGLQESDFCLIIMDKSQSELYKKFGEKYISIDSTHGLNAYDFELTTLMSVDEFNTGIPLAFMFSNRKDSYINEVFFKSIKQILGLISTDTFMSDITEVFYGPWKKIMGPANNQLYCSWHVDRAWQSNLSKVGDSETKDWVYKTLKYLQTLLNVEMFEKNLEDFLKLLNNSSCLKFKEYFCTYYVPYVEKWAYCYRTGCAANTNMHLESIHKTLKYHYLQGKKIKRLDKTVHVLMEFLRNKKIERVIKLTKGSTSEYVKKIHTHHRVAISSQFAVEVIQPDIYFSVTNKSNNTKYWIKKNFLEKPICCAMKCSICCICIHAYSCTCADFSIRTTICKHLHYIALKFLNNPFNRLETAGESQQEVCDIFQSLTTSSVSKKQQLIQEINDRALNIINNIQNTDYTVDQLKIIQNNIRKVECASNVESFNIKAELLKEPANKNILKQVSFKSTRKKNRNKNLKRKPNHQEKETIKEILAQSLILSNDSRNDHMYLKN